MPDGGGNAGSAEKVISAPAIAAIAFMEYDQRSPAISLIVRDQDELFGGAVAEIEVLQRACECFVAIFEVVRTWRRLQPIRLTGHLVRRPPRIDRQNESLPGRALELEHLGT